MQSALIIQCNCAVRWKVPFTDSELQGLARVMLDAAGLFDSYSELSIIDDASMAVLHAQSLDCRGPTNILSFPAVELPPGKESLHARRSEEWGTEGESSGEKAFIGWLALSADTLRRESFLYGQQVEAHCIRLLAHGLAHLLGHDHGHAMDSLCEYMESEAHALKAVWC